jgi:hypothetical protein
MADNIEDRKEIFGLNPTPEMETRALLDAPEHVRNYVAEVRSAKLEGRAIPEYRPVSKTDKWTTAAILRASL